MEFNVMVAVFILLSCCILGYLIYSFKTQKRTHILIEVIILGIYLFTLCYAFFFTFFQKIFSILGIPNPTIFFVYLSIFFLFFICFILYKKMEEQRIDITKLVREIAFINHKQEKGKPKKK